MKITPPTPPMSHVTVMWEKAPPLFVTSVKGLRNLWTKPKAPFLNHATSCNGSYKGGSGGSLLTTLPVTLTLREVGVIFNYNRQKWEVVLKSVTNFH